MNTSTDSIPTIEHSGDSADRDADVETIKQIVENIETGFNTNDAELGVEHFAANASVVNAVGVRISGRDDLLDSHRKGFTGFLKDEHARYEVDDVVFVRPDVAVAHKLAWTTDAAGEPLNPDPAMVAQYVLAKEQGRWWIVARANVPIPT